MHSEILLLKELSVKKSFERIPLFNETLKKIKDIMLDEDDTSFLTELYMLLKDIQIRNYVLQTLAINESCNLRDFFYCAFKRERYLDMKLTAIRGFAKFAAENEVEELVNKFTELLIKRQETTPCNYEEYEQIRSVFGLPYLIKKYKYKCFKDAFEQEEKQYKAMPKDFKGFFTLDEKGNTVELMRSKLIKKKMDAYFKHQT